MINKVPLSELESRLQRFRDLMNSREPDWELALVISKINQFYFTGTMQEGLLFIPRDGDAVMFVRRSYERALDESLFPNIQPMESYRDAASYLGKLPSSVHLESEFVPLGMYERLKKYFGFTAYKPLDGHIMAVRSVKSPYEMGHMLRSGQIHRKVMEERMPAVLKEGMSEGELMAEIFKILQQEGHHGVARFGMFDTEVLLGLVSFGKSSLYPTYFNGPGGGYGSGPAVQLMGGRETRLAHGDLVFIDIGCGSDGYHTDKTVTYVFGGSLPEAAVRVHNQCVEVQNRVAEMLRPGAIPSSIYQTVMSDLDEAFLANFMGFGSRRVKFLGHGIGLQTDETPVIAKGFDEPIQEGMFFAVEPKVGIEGIGMVGIENTFLVTADGGRCITGDHPGLMAV